MNSFFCLIAGNATKKHYVVLNMIATAVLLIGIFVAASYYNHYGKTFSFLTVQISELGSPSKNSDGYLIFAIAMVLAGLLFIPSTFYFYKIFLPDAKVMSYLSSVFLFIGVIGLIMVGIFNPRLNYEMHALSAFLAIGGIITSYLSSVICVAKKMARKASWPKVAPIVLIYGGFLSVLLAALLLVGLPLLMKGVWIMDLHGAPPYWEVCEWAIFFSGIIWISGVLIISPKDLDHH